MFIYQRLRHHGANGSQIVLLEYLLAQFEIKKFIKASSDAGIKTIATVVDGYKGRRLNIDLCQQIAQDLGATLRVREWITNGYS